MSMLTDIARLVLPHLADAALHASVLVLFVLALQTIMGNRLSPQWRAALWFLVVLRLTVPVSVPAPFSIYNVLPMPAVSTLRLDVHTERPPSSAWGASTLSLARSAPLSRTTDTMAPCPGPQHTAALPAPPAAPPAAPASPPAALQPSLPAVLLLFWASGALLVMAGVLRASMRCGQIARGAEPAGAEITLAAQEAARLMRARRALPVRISEDPRCADIGPFLIGLFRPKVILPASFAHSANALDLRCVLMHEMAHRRCSDLYINCLLAFLTAVHWFNPLVWIAFRSLRGERELLRDAMVLSHLQDDQRPHYARLLASFGGLPVPGRGVLPETPAIAATMASRVPSLHRRVSMSLHSPRTEHRLRTLIRYAVITAVGAVTLTGAAAHTPSPSAPCERQPAEQVPEMTRLDAGAHGTPWRASIEFRGDLAYGVIGMPCGFHQMFDHVTSEQGLITYVRHLARHAPEGDNPPPGGTGPVDAESWKRYLAPAVPQKYQSIDVPVRAEDPARSTRVTLGHEVELSLPGPDGAPHTVAMLDGLSLSILVAAPEERGTLQVSLQGRFTELQPAQQNRFPTAAGTLHEALIDVTRTIAPDHVIMLMVPLVRSTPIGVRIAGEPGAADAPPDIIFDRQAWNEPVPFDGADPDRSPGYLLLFIRFDAEPHAEAHPFPIIPQC